MLAWLGGKRFHVILVGLLALTPQRSWAQDPLDKVNALLERAKAIKAKAKATRDSANALLERGKGAKPEPARDAALPTTGGERSEPRGPEAGAKPAVQLGTAKVDEQVVAPNEQGLAYYISPKGGHLIAVVSKGSRFAVSFDGVAGPTFDVIMRAGSAVSFSPDGQRYAYTARAGTDWVVMVDGKEAVRGPIGRFHALIGGGGFEINFTPNSKHWFFSFHDNGAPPEQARIYWDGVAGPPGGQLPVTVSPDGDRHAYIAHASSGQTTLIVDGKPVPGIGGVPQFSADGTVLFTTRDIAPIQGRPTQEILANGRPVMRVEQAKLFLPPAGNQFVAQVLRRAPNGMDAFFLVAGGKKVEGSDAGMHRGPWFSADGRHWAAIAGMPGQRMKAIVDGKVHQEYDGIDTVAFSPEGKAVYAARSGAKMFVMVDGVETEAAFMVVPKFDFKFSKTGRIGWIAPSDQSANLIVVDGKVTAANGRANIGDFGFSPDGAKFAYFSGALGAPFGNVLVDHAATPGTTQPFVEWKSGAPTHYIWSPDGKYLVQLTSPTPQSTGEHGFAIAGKYLPLGKHPRVVAPTFTPDGKHLFWMMEDGQTEMLRVFLDGKQVFESDLRGRDPLKYDGNWEMGADGVLTFIVQTVEGMKRVRITPGAENGFETYLAQGKALR